MLRHFALAFIAACAGSLFSLPASAAGRALYAEPVQGVKIRIDGDLREWPNKMVDLGETLEGSSSGGDPRVAATVGYDDANLYVVLKVFDKRIVRTKAAGQNEDHATLYIAFPKGRDFVNYDVKLYPGEPGKIAGSVRMRGNVVKGAKLVEAPTDKGYHLEAQIPWSAFPEAARVRVGMRAAIAYTDSDAAGSVKAVVATANGRGRALPPLLLEAEQGVETSVIRAKGLSSNPGREVYGNVSGDGMYERVAVYGSSLIIVGPHFRGGKEFFFADLAIENAGMVTRLELEDFDGDGRQEIVMQRRIGGKDRYREILTVHKVDRDDSPYQAFAHEVGVKTPDGYITNKVKIGDGTIEISQGDSHGFEPDSYKEDLPSDMGSTIFPWDSVGSKIFRWKGKGFESAGETAHTPKLASKSKAKSKAKSRAAEGPVAPPAPRPPTAEEMLDRVYALYRKERGARGKPNFDFVTDVAGDRTPERVVIHGKDIVVFGKAFREGTSFAFISVGVADPKDIFDVTARDLTGDGKAEIIIRAVLHAKASKALGGDVIDRHALLVYSVVADKVVRIFGAETGRALGKDQIIGAVAFTPGQRGLDIELRPARAVGWTEQSYPFPPDTTAAGGLEPLLLPWGGAAPRRYRFNGSAYTMD